MNATGSIARSLGAALSASALAVPVSASPAGSTPRELPDVFIGTLERNGSEIILRRCDVAENRYVLVDAPGSHALAAVRKIVLPAYGEVLGSYTEHRERSILRVESVGNLTTGKNCHLLDTLDAMDKMYGVTASDPKAPAAAGWPDPAFAGHYHLSGARETGSELLLDKDGTFQWFLAYGAVDQTAQGEWHREGDTIVLSAAMPATDKPLFGYLKTDPWSEEAEELLRQRDRDRQMEAVRVACPFQTTAWVSTPAPVSVGGGPPKPPADILRRDAASTRAKAVALRTRVEALARQAMAKGAPPLSDEMSEQLNTLMSDWMEAKGRAATAAREAGLPDPALGEPALPPACDVPPVAETVPDDPSQWRGGLAARVFDADSEQAARNVRITLRFADGHTQDVLTASRGFALLPAKPATAVVGATLHAVYAKGRDASFTFAPVRTGILQFSIDIQQLAEPPFATLRLKIADRALVPTEFGQGRYERKP